MPGTLRPINRLDLALHEIKRSAKPSSLVVWDIDDVILTPKDLVLRKRSRELLDRILGEIRAGDPNEYVEQLCLAWQSTEEELVERSVVTIFDEIKSMDVRQIALSAPPAGKQGVIDDMHTFRRNALLHFGIDFSYSFATPDALWLKPSDATYIPPFFKDGVIIGGVHGKGFVLVDFLKTVNFLPEHIYFIDDLMENLENVQVHLDDMNVDHTLFHYDSYVLQKDPEIEHAIANLQFELMKTHGVWLNDPLFQSVQKYLSSTKR